MEKIKHIKAKDEKNQKNKEINKKHHHKRLSIDKMNSRFLNFIAKEKNQKNINKNKETKIKEINISNINDAKKNEFNYYQKSSHKKNSINVPISEMDKNYIKNKINAIDNTNEKSENKKDIKYQVVDYNIIINNNKTNVYFKENNSNLTFSKEINEKTNLNDSSKNNYINNKSQLLKDNINEQEDLIQNQKNIQKKNKKENNDILNNIKDINNINNNFQNNEIILSKKNTTKNSIQNENNSNSEEEEKEDEISNSKSSTNKNEIENNKNKYKDEKNDLINQKNNIAKENFRIKLDSYLSEYVDINLILETYPGGFNYLQNRLEYLNESCSEEEFNFIYNQKNLYKSQNAKELCRKGIPLKYFQKFTKKLLKLENCEENYTLKYSMIIKDLDTNYIGNYVPYYYGKKKIKLKEILSTYYLNEEGLKQLKIIMWLISDLVPKIEYSPFFVKICSILLLFFDKEETFEIMRTLIEMNYDPNDIYKLRWHFRYSFEENKKLIESIKIFLENQSDNIKELFYIFRQKGLDPLLLINEFVESLFLDFLNFYGIFRFICLFLYEGVKSLYRVSYGILNYIYINNLDEIKSCQKNLLFELKKIIFNALDYNKIFRECFDIKLSRFNNGYIKNNFGEDIEELEIPFECASKYYKDNTNLNNNDLIQDKENKENDYISHYYLPSIEPKSNILTSKYIFKLWPKLPKIYKNCNLATIYSLSRKKINMRSIIELSSKYPTDYKILILVETEKEELFGIILPKMLKDTGVDTYIKIDKCYLINFKPEINIYKNINEKKCENMLCCNKKGLWFCKDDEGDLIFIDGTLTEGKTCKKNNYFGDVRLTKKNNFLIKDFEIILFVKNDI